MRLFTIGIVAAVIAACAMMGQDETQTDMEYICERLELECTDLAEPIVVVTDAVGPFYYGFYIHGEPYVFVNSNYPQEQIERTAFHETVHYVVYWTNTDLTRCENEELARVLTAEFFGMTYSTKWHDQYGCAEELADERVNSPVYRADHRSVR